MQEANEGATVDIGVTLFPMDETMSPAELRERIVIDKLRGDTDLLDAVASHDGR